MICNSVEAAKAKQEEVGCDQKPSLELGYNIFIVISITWFEVPPQEKVNTNNSKTFKYNLLVPLLYWSNQSQFDKNTYISTFSQNLRLFNLIMT